MKRILFVDDVYENGVPRYEIKHLPTKVSALKNTRIDFKTILPNIIELEGKAGLTYKVPEFDNYDLIFVHTSYDKPTINEKVISDLVERYQEKMYRFAGSYVPKKNGLGRKEMYNNLYAFAKLIDNFDQIDMEVLIYGPNDYLERKYQKLLYEIDNPMDWSMYLTDNWWSYLQSFFKLSLLEVIKMKEEFHSFEYFSEFDDKLEEIKNQSYRRFFL